MAIDLAPLQERFPTLDARAIQEWIVNAVMGSMRQSTITGQFRSTTIVEGDHQGNACHDLLAQRAGRA